MKVQRILIAAAAVAACASAFILGRASAPDSDLVITPPSTAIYHAALDEGSMLDESDTKTAATDVSVLSVEAVSENAQTSYSDNIPNTTIVIDTTDDIDIATALESTKVPETTEVPETVKTPETVKVPETVKALETTKALETVKTSVTAKAAETINISVTAKAAETVNVSETTAQDNHTAVYVLNTSTKKIHAQTCQYVKQIKPENYATTTDFATATAQGYERCKKCNP